MGTDFIVEGNTEIEVRGMTCRDFIFCEDCQEYVDLWRYDGILDNTGHGKCKWRYVTNEELRMCVADCEEYVPYCPRCDSIVDYEINAGKPCMCGEPVTPNNAVWRNFFDEEE